MFYPLDLNEWRQPLQLYKICPNSLWWYGFPCKAVRLPQYLEHTNIPCHKLKKEFVFWSLIMQSHCCQKSLFPTTYTIKEVGPRKIFWIGVLGIIKFKLWGYNFYNSIATKLGWTLGYAHMYYVLIFIQTLYFQPLLGATFF